MSTDDYNRGVSDGAAAERRRIGAILSMNEAKMLPEMAASLAFRHPTSAEAALGILKAAVGTDGGRAGSSWNDVIEKLNAEAPQTQSHPRAGQDGAGWGGVVEDLNASNGFSR